MHTFIDMFAGIGGFRLGLERAGFKCVWASETDRYARWIYRHRFGDMPAGDIREVRPDKVPDFDILCAGFPCQGFSICGKRKGFDDERGRLFFEIVRIAEHKRPKILFLENVKGLLGHDRGRTFAVVLASLSEIGYDLQWQVLNTRDWLPQNRERVFIVGHLRGERRPEVFPLRQEAGMDRQVSAAEGEQFVNCIDSNYYKGVDKHGQRTVVALTETRTEEGKVVRKRYREESGRDYSPRREKCLVPREDGIMNCVTAVQGKEHLILERLTPESNSSKRVYSTKCAAAVRTGGANTGLYLVDQKIRRLTPLECERLQGFPDNWTKYGMNDRDEMVEISDTQRYKCCGNAVTVNVVESIARKLTGPSRACVCGSGPTP